VSELSPVDPAAARIAELAVRPEAARSARDCTWIPGTGYCSGWTCRAQCAFRNQLEEEAQRVIHERRRRSRQRAAGAANRGRGSAG